MSLDAKMDINWVREVIRERRRILVTNKTPLQILTEMFELYQDEFDVTSLKSKQPELYNILQEFCLHVPTSDEQLCSSSYDLVKFFMAHQDEIREGDIDLYYALLGFVDMLKTKRIFYTI